MWAAKLISGLIIISPGFYFYKQIVKEIAKVVISIRMISRKVENFLYGSLISGSELCAVSLVIISALLSHTCPNSE